MVFRREVKCCVRDEVARDGDSCVNNVSSYIILSMFSLFLTAYN